MMVEFGTPPGFIWKCLRRNRLDSKFVSLVKTTTQITFTLSLIIIIRKVLPKAYIWYSFFPAPSIQEWHLKEARSF